MASASLPLAGHPLLLCSDANGACLVRHVATGRRQVKRKLRPKRVSRTRVGFTRAHGERELRRLIDEVAAEPVLEDVTLEQVGRRHVDGLQLLGRERSTLMDYESTLRVHLVPFFGDCPVASITPAQIERDLTGKLRAGRAPKSIRNDLGLRFGILAFAEKRGWVHDHRPVRRCRSPPAGHQEPAEGQHPGGAHPALQRAVQQDCW